MKCIRCNEREIFVKKRALCQRCYMREYYSGKMKLDAYAIGNGAEMEFIKNYFDHNNWIYEPASFRLESSTYTPDFYDAERNVFIEVSGTLSAYRNNEHKYQEMEERFPKIKLEVRAPDGKLINESNLIFKRNGKSK